MTNPFSPENDKAEYVGKDGLESADGQGLDAAFVSAREPAWHRLGKVFDRDLTPEDVLVEGKLGGWDVQKLPVRSELGDVKGQFVITRVNPYTNVREHLGGPDARTHPTVGNIFKPIQMEQCLDLLGALQDQTRGRFETAGSLSSGARVFVSMKLPDSMLIGGVDPVDRYVTLINPNDGSGSLIILDTPIRAVCRNTCNAAIRDAASKVSIWHTESADKSIQRIREALGVTYKFDAAFQAEADRMIFEPATEAWFVENVCREIWPEPKADAPVRTRNGQKRRELELVSLFVESPTMKNIAGTKWGAYNAVTEYLDWKTPVGDNRDADTVRATRTLTLGSRVETDKEKAFALCRVAR